MGRLAAADDKMFAEVQAPSFFRECPPVDEFRARFGQGAFAEIRKFYVEFPRQDELQDRVAEKFQPLIVQDPRALLMGD